MRSRLGKKPRKPLHLRATKTIGGYVTHIFKNMVGESAGYREVAGPFSVARQAIARLVLAEGFKEMYSVRITKIPLTRAPNGRIVGNYAISITVDQANATADLMREGWTVTAAYRAVGREFEDGFRKGMMFDSEVLIMTRNCDQIAYAVPRPAVGSKWQRLGSLRYWTSSAKPRSLEKHMTSAMQSIDRVQAGSIITAYAQFILPWSLDDLSRSRVQWELIDVDGRSYNQGDGGPVDARPSPIRPDTVIVRSDSEIGIPSNMPASVSGSRYQIKWALITPGRETMFSFDNFSIYPPEYERLGALDVVDLFGSVSEASVRLPYRPAELYVELYRKNTKIAERVVTSNPTETSDGFLFVEQFDLMQMGGIGPSLVPLSVVWRHRANSSDPWATETSSMWSVNPTILTASRDLEMFMNRAYIDSGIDPGTVFTPPDLMRHLRKGMDIFNSVVRPTDFNMTNAEGSIRQFWLAYAAVDGCRAQYLAEGMKTFNYGGATVSLDVDRTSYWDSVASALQGETDQYVKPLKDNLAKWGVFGGDGSTPRPQVGSIGAIGISLSPITPLRQGYFRFFGTGVPFSL